MNVLWMGAKAIAVCARAALASGDALHYETDAVVHWPRLEPLLKPHMGVRSAVILLASKPFSRIS